MVTTYHLGTHGSIGILSLSLSLQISLGEFLKGRLCDDSGKMMSTGEAFLGFQALLSTLMHMHTQKKAFLSSLSLGKDICILGKVRAISLSWAGLQALAPFESSHLTFAGRHSRSSQERGFLQWSRQAIFDRPSFTSSGCTCELQFSLSSTFEATHTPFLFLRKTDRHFIAFAVSRLGFMLSSQIGNWQDGVGKKH